MWSPHTTAFYHSRPTSPKFGEKSQLPSKKSNSHHMTKKGFVRLNSMESMSSTTSSNASMNSNPNSSSVGVKSDFEKTLDPKIRTPMSAKESKWFGKYQNDYQYHQYQPQYWNNQQLNPHQKWNTNQHSQQNQYFGQIEQHNPQSHYWPQYQYQVPQHPNHQDSHYWPQYQYQVPYNLTKGQFEVWQMEAMATGIDQMSYSSQHIVYQDPQQGHNQCYCPEQESGFSKCVNSFFQWGSALVATAATAVSTLKESTTSFTSTLNPDLGSSGGVDPGVEHPGVGYPEVMAPISTTSSLASSLNPNAQEFTPAKPSMGSTRCTPTGSTGSAPAGSNGGAPAGSPGGTHGVGAYPDALVVKPGELINAKDIHSAEKSIKIVPDELQNHENSEISTNCNNKTSPLEKQTNTVNDSEPVTPPNGPEMIELKAVNQRKCTPWIHKGGSIPKVSGDKDDTFEGDDILEEEEDFDDNISDDGSDFEADSVTCNSPTRLRLLSICSSEDGIHFEGSSPTAGQLSAASPKYKIDQSKCSPFLKSFLAGPDDLSEEESDNDNIDDNDDWDKVSDDNQIGFEIDLELEFGLPSIPNLHTIQTVKKDSKIDDEVDHNQLTSMKNQPHQINIDKKRTAALCCEGERFPTSTDSVDVNYAHQLLMKIKEANEKWDFLDSDSQKTSNPDSQNSKKVRNVAFSEPLVSGIKLEDPEMADELRVARVGEYNFVQRSADQDRYNRLLGPVFQPEHRDKIRSYIAELNSRVI